MAVVAALLLLAGVALCQQSEPDRKVGRAMFHIVKSGGESVTIEPMMVPQFRMHRLTGENNPAESLVTCDIYARTIGVDEEKQVKMTATVLKCGGEEYAIEEVDFVMVDR